MVLAAGHVLAFDSKAACGQQAQARRATGSVLLNTWTQHTASCALILTNIPCYMVHVVLALTCLCRLLTQDEEQSDI
jgi:hypothetical protein